MRTLIMILMTVLCFTAEAEYKSRYADPAEAKTMTEMELRALDSNIDNLIIDLCGYDAELAKWKALIDRQKRIEKVSGVYDKNEIYAATSHIVDIEAAKDSRNSDYKKLFGHDITAKECKEYGQ